MLTGLLWMLVGFDVEVDLVAPMVISVAAMLQRPVGLGVGSMMKRVWKMGWCERSRLPPTVSTDALERGFGVGECVEHGSGDLAEVGGEGHRRGGVGAQGEDVEDVAHHAVELGAARPSATER